MAIVKVGSTGRPVSTIRELGARHTGRSCSDRATSARWEIFDSEGFFFRSFGSPRWPRWLGSLVLEFSIFVDDRYPQGHEQAITPAGAIRLLFLGRPTDRWRPTNCLVLM